MLYIFVFYCTGILLHATQSHSPIYLLPTVAYIGNSLRLTYRHFQKKDSENGVRAYKNPMSKRHGTKSAVPPKLHINKLNMHLENLTHLYVISYSSSEIKLVDDFRCIQNYNLPPYDCISLSPTAVTLPVTVIIIILFLYYDILKCF